LLSFWRQGLVKYLPHWLQTTILPIATIRGMSSWCPALTFFFFFFCQSVVALTFYLDWPWTPDPSDLWFPQSWDFGYEPLHSVCFWSWCYQ
jgi:hypothetical protein